MRRTHGATGTRTYRIWLAMRGRCEKPTNTAFRYYGGRGIRVCDRWRQSFEAFLCDMGESPDGLTLERIDPDGDYEPQNCRWASRLEQMRNTKRSRFVEWRGERHTVSEWAERLGVRYSLIQRRLDRGWPVERAFTARRQIVRNTCTASTL